MYLLFKNIIRIKIIIKKQQKKIFTKYLNNICNSIKLNIYVYVKFTFYFGKIKLNKKFNISSFNQSSVNKTLAVVCSFVRSLTNNNFCSQRRKTMYTQDRSGLVFRLIILCLFYTNIFNIHKSFPL